MKKSPTRFLILLTAATFALLLGSSCRTFRGFGQDVEHAGNHIERAARG